MPSMTSETLHAWRSFSQPYPGGDRLRRTVAATGPFHLKARHRLFRVCDQSTQTILHRLTQGIVGTITE